MNSKLSDDMKSGIAECQKSCNNLKQKFGVRLAVDTNRNVKENSMCTITDDIFLRGLIMMLVDATLKTIKDDQLGIYSFGFCLIIMSDRFLVAAEKISRWLSAPDSSKNYNEAREKHQKDTCSWFLNGMQFRDFQEKGGILWIKGTGKLPDNCCGRGRY